MKRTPILFFLGIGIFLFSNCKKEEDQKAVAETGKLKIEFNHTVDNQTVQLNTNIYVNEAGNHYELADIMYFISDLTLYSHNGTSLLINDWTAIHYIDINIPTTLTWNIYDPIPTGVYDSISFVFGLDEQRNQSFAFANPPESNMFWPDVLGGGYHYMMINGKWVNQQNVVTPFDFHLGIGQIYSDTINYNVNTITGFVQNYFKVTLPISALQISKNITSTIVLKMEIESWFKTPNIWDHNYWGGSVMQNQRALKTIKENGFDVFSVGSK